MRKHVAGAIGALASAAALAISTVGAASATAAPSASGGKTLVIDNSFQLVTADPGHMFEPSGELVDNGLYDTLVTFQGSDLKTVVPDLATSWTSLENSKKYIFHLNPKARFSDGTPVTSADVVWSLDRMVNLKGNPSFLLAGEKIVAQGPETVVMTSALPNPALPYILPNPATGVLNSKLVKAHGGTDAANASTKDTAENWLNNHSAGSGPYVLSSFSTTTQVVMKANPNYWGAKPAYSTVDLRNVQAPVQGLDVERGANEIAVDLSPAQTKSLSGVQIKRAPSPNVFFLFTNNDPTISTVTSNPWFQKAVRAAINYKSLVALAGTGSVQTPGVVPTVFLGALPSSADSKTSVSVAKADLAKSGLKNPSVALTYPTDVQVNGINFGDLAARVQQDLQQVGITVTLQPQSVQVALQTYRGGKEAMGLWEWGPDFPDPSDYLVFGPGHLVGLRAGWTTADAPGLATLAQKAADTTGTAARQSVFQAFQQQLNQRGPFMPLIQTAQVVVATKSVKNVQGNGLWLVDLRNLG
ncbi:MAG: extracellular solute-binding protein [Acidimicrobiaceae bacterium]|nr:extracellular solute-binding protein [Acidimicrobiaceae bacterium]